MTDHPDAIVTVHPNDGRYYLGIWILADTKADWMATIWRNIDGLWTGVVRMRRYVDRKIFDSADPKESKTLPPIQGDEAFMLDLIRTLHVTAAAVWPTEEGPRREEILIQGDAERFREVMTARPSKFIHAKKGKA